MQVLFILVASLFAFGSTFNLSYVLPDGERWFVPNFMKGTSEWVKRSVVKTELEMLKNANDLVKYYLWTEDNPKSGQLLVLGDPSSIHQSKFNKSNPTRIITHGFQASSKSKVCTLVRDAYLKTGPHNVICIDWGRIAYRAYPTARFSVPSVGNDLAEFIVFLGKTTGMSKKDLIVVGHSLGTHVVGYAGKFLIKANNKLPWIVVCDPAHPLFSYKDCSSRICNTDADFVESIHTTAGRIAFSRPIGDGAYYPNGGSVQPGCGVDANAKCAHLRSYKYFAEAIVKNDFPTKKCSSYKTAMSNKCGNKYSSVKMGSMESYGKKGVFYVPVNSKPPYGKGS